MIKQIIYISMALVLSATFTGCTENDEPVVKPDSDRYITFGVPVIDMEETVGDFDSRATVSRAGTIPFTDKEFKVWGFLQGRNTDGTLNPATISVVWNDKATLFTQGADVFSSVNTDSNYKGIPVTVNNGETTYNDGDWIPWVQDKTTPYYSFFAVADPTSQVTSVLTAADMSTTNPHGPRLTITLPMNESDLTTTRSLKDQPDVKVAWKFNHLQAKGNVNLAFKHIMTGIRFRFKNLTNDNLYIKKVTYQGSFYKEATYYLNNENPVMKVNTENKYSCTFTLFDNNGLDANSQIIPANENGYMGGDDSPTTLLLLPNPDGTTTPDSNFTLGTDKVIEITYERRDAEGNIVVAEKTFTLKTETLHYIPKPNTLHTATFNFVGDRFLLMFEADNTAHWQNGSDSNITIH